MKPNAENWRLYVADLGDARTLLKECYCPRFPRHAVTGQLCANFQHEITGSRSEYPEQFARIVMAHAEELLALAATFQPYQPGSAKRKVAELFGLKAA